VNWAQRTDVIRAGRLPAFNESNTKGNMDEFNKNLIDEFLAENWAAFESFCQARDADAEQVADDLKNSG
jgi:hypothetical protein